jgi:hypothetical protein
VTPRPKTREVAAMPDGEPDLWSDDDRLLAELGEAVRAADDVPGRFVDAAKAAFAWRTIDAELARLSYDSLDDEQTRVVTRADDAAVRALTFMADRLTIELEITAESVLGQVVPAQPGQLFVQVGTDQQRTSPIDEVGCFVVEPVPTGPFRLHCRTADGAEVRTGWITL